MYHTKATCVQVRDYRLYFEGDTLINALIYKKLYATGIMYQEAAAPNSPCDTTVYSFARQYEGAVRYDSGKVHFVENTYNFEQTIYDYTLQVGDSVPGNYSFKKQVIVSIDSVQITGDYYRRFNLDNGQYVIEGIGSGRGLVEPAYPYSFESHFEFLCYAEGDSVLYPPGANCALNVSLEDAVEKLNINVYPNPADEVIRITAPGLYIEAVEMADVSGRIIYSGNSSSIDVSGLSQGIYLLRINTSKGAVVRKVQVLR